MSDVRGVKSVNDLCYSTDGFFLYICLNENLPLHCEVICRRSCPKDWSVCWHVTTCCVFPHKAVQTRDDLAPVWEISSHQHEQLE